MKKLVFLLVLCAVAIGLAMLLGCSDDDDDDANPIITGDPNSPSYQLYDHTVAEVPGEIAQISLNLPLGLIEFQFGGKSGGRGWPTGLGADSVTFDSVSWTYTNGWHVFYFELSEFTSEPEDGGGTREDSMWIIGWDSLRLFEDGSVVAAPGDALDSLYSREHVVVTLANSQGDHWSVAGHHQLTVYNVRTDISYGSIIEVDMQALDSAEAVLIDPDDHECNLAMVTTVSLLDILIPAELIDEVCPSSGQFGATQTVDLSCGGGTATDSISFNGTWIMSEVFVNGVAYQTLTFGNTRWTQIDSCGVPLMEM